MVVAREGTSIALVTSIVLVVKNIELFERRSLVVFSHEHAVVQVAFDIFLFLGTFLKRLLNAFPHRHLQTPLAACPLGGKIDHLIVKVPRLAM